MLHSLHWVRIFERVMRAHVSLPLAWSIHPLIGFQGIPTFSDQVLSQVCTIEGSLTHASFFSCLGKFWSMEHLRASGDDIVWASLVQRVIVYVHCCVFHWWNIRGNLRWSTSCRNILQSARRSLDSFWCILNWVHLSMVPCSGSTYACQVQIRRPDRAFFFETFKDWQWLLERVICLFVKL